MRLSAFLPSVLVATSLWAAAARPAAGPDGGSDGPIPAIHGYGAVTAGGLVERERRKRDVCTVSSLEDSGPGSLRACVAHRTGPREIRFAVAGTIVVKAASSTIVIREPYLTINGFSAPPPGITITKDVECFDAVRVGATHDVVIAGLRFKGLWKPGDPHPNPQCRDQNATNTLAVDGDTAPGDGRRDRRGGRGSGGEAGEGHANPRGVSRVVVAYNTFANGHDSNPDYWGDVQDATHQANLVIDSWHPSTISYKQATPRRFPRQRISWYANVYARNGERQPQLANGVYEFDMRDNVIYGWQQPGGGGYGLRFKGISGDLPTSPVNVIHNAFLAAGSDPDRGCVFGEKPAREEGPDGRIAAMQVFFEDNLFPSGRRFAGVNCLTTPAAKGAPFPVPERAQLPRLDFAEVVRRVGMPHHTPAEQALLDEISAALPAR